MPRSTWIPVCNRSLCFQPMHELWKDKLNKTTSREIPHIYHECLRKCHLSFSQPCTRASFTTCAMSRNILQVDGYSFIYSFDIHLIHLHLLKIYWTSIFWHLLTFIGHMANRPVQQAVDQLRSLALPAINKYISKHHYQQYHIIIIIIIIARTTLTTMTWRILPAVLSHWAMPVQWSSSSLIRILMNAVYQMDAVLQSHSDCRQQIVIMKIRSMKLLCHSLKLIKITFIKKIWWHSQ